MSGLEDLLFRLNTAGTGDHSDGALPYGQTARFHDRWLRLHFDAGHFVGRENRNDLGNSGSTLQRLARFFTFFTNRSNHRSFGPDDDMSLEPQALYARNHMVNLVLGGTVFHDNNHRIGLRLAEGIF